MWRRQFGKSSRAIGLKAWLSAISQGSRELPRIVLPLCPHRRNNSVSFACTPAWLGLYSRRMDTDKPTLQRAIALEASGDYRVLRKLPRRWEFSAEEGDVKLGVILDIETTGLNPTSDEIIELGMLKFAFSSEGRVFKVVDEFEQFRQPSIALPPEMTKLTGITGEMVAGKAIDPEHVSAFLADVVLIIAHEARFD